MSISLKQEIINFVKESKQATLTEIYGLIDWESSPLNKVTK